ncbi:MAG TPA: AgmX/PglI C-terminal domain-containing protein [Kofleriaceae bacterium]|nr:AgmX/PglI C-terminal domain-containing protein [Kofleriaceae bacterium]
MNMRTHSIAWAGALAVALAACGGAGGGGGDPVVEPGPCPECSEPDDTGPDDSADGTLIPEEKYEEIRKTFERKTGTVSRCYVEGFEKGEVEKTEKGYVTVGLVIGEDGRPSDVRVLDTSFRSGAVGDCVVRMVSGWTFTTLPKPLETSHTYVLDRL